MTVFKITCIGAEVGAVMLFLNAKWKAVQHLLVWKIALIAMSSILAFKMFVNVFQWIGGIERLWEHSNKARASPSKTK